MRAIILAAGVGQRLSALGERRGPKSLLRFGKHSLLERHIHLLNGLGVREISIVVGYEAQQIEQMLAAMPLPRRPLTLLNP